MVFYIVAVICVIVLIVTTVEDEFLTGILSFVISAVIGGVALIMLFTLIPQNKIEISKETYSLRAIDTGSSIEGHSFFLGGGYVNEKRVLNYLYEDSSNAQTWTSVAVANADDSRIFEDETKKPNVVVSKFAYRNGWIFPFDFNVGTKTYDFHIPEGSVMNSYEITNK